MLAPLEIITLLRESKKENGKIGIQCALAYNQKLDKRKTIVIVVVLFCMAGIASKIATVRGICTCNCDSCFFILSFLVTMGKY